APFTVCKTEFVLEPGMEKVLRLAPDGTCRVTGSITVPAHGIAPPEVRLFFARRDVKPFAYHSANAIDGAFDVRGLPEGTSEVSATAFHDGVRWSAVRPGRRHRGRCADRTRAAERGVGEVEVEPVTRPAAR